MEQPLREIVANAGDEPSRWSTRSSTARATGYNAATGEYGDMVEMGVLDPTKVTRTALQNAASVAGLMLTTDCMVAELAEDKLAGGMPGGMGGMGGMGGKTAASAAVFLEGPAASPRPSRHLFASRPSVLQKSIRAASGRRRSNCRRPRSVTGASRVAAAPDGTR